jgi:N,N'-diacetyllegionaminate synthase
VNHSTMKFESGRCLIIGEVGQAHDGSLGLAHSFIDVIAKSGADAVKFQTHIAAAESTPSEPWRVKFSRQDDSRFQYWQRMEFTESQWQGLKDHADDAGLYFLSSPFSLEAVDLLRRVGVSAWKVASGEVTNTVLLDQMTEDGQPVLLSSGMSKMEELSTAVRQVKAKGVPFVVMQCTSAYPTPPEEVGLNLLATYREKFDCRVGLSDHSGTIFPSLAATVLGAEVVEVHVTLSREMFGPDVCASVTPDELSEMVRGIRFVERMLAHPLAKNLMADQLEPLRKMFTKSVVAARDLEKGKVLEGGDLAVKKPGSGLPPERLSSLLGRRVRRDLAKDEVFQEDDLS